MALDVDRGSKCPLARLNGTRALPAVWRKVIGAPMAMAHGSCGEVPPQEHRKGTLSEMAEPLKAGACMAEDQGQSWGAVTLDEEVDSLVRSQPALRTSATGNKHRKDEFSSIDAQLPYGYCASGGKDSCRTAAPQACASARSSSADLCEPSVSLQQDLHRLHPETGAVNGTFDRQHQRSDCCRDQPALIAAPRMTSTVAILRHSAAVCSALGRAAARVTAQVRVASSSELHA